jgi:hypothetical protein
MYNLYGTYSLAMMYSFLDVSLPSIDILLNALHRLPAIDDDACPHLDPLGA